MLLFALVDLREMTLGWFVAHIVIYVLLILVACNWIYRRGLRFAKWQHAKDELPNAYFPPRFSREGSHSRTIDLWVPSVSTLKPVAKLKLDIAKQLQAELARYVEETEVLPPIRGEKAAIVDALPFLVSRAMVPFPRRASPGRHEAFPPP